MDKEKNEHLMIKIEDARKLIPRLERDVADISNKMRTARKMINKSIEQPNLR